MVYVLFNTPMVLIVFKWKLVLLMLVLSVRVENMVAANADDSVKDMIRHKYKNGYTLENPA